MERSAVAAVRVRQRVQYPHPLRLRSVPAATCRWQTREKGLHEGPEYSKAWWEVAAWCQGRHHPSHLHAIFFNQSSSHTLSHPKARLTGEAGQVRVNLSGASAAHTRSSASVSVSMDAAYDMRKQLSMPNASPGTSATCAPFAP